MDNIIQTNEKREKLLSNIGRLGCFLFILTGVIGCSIIKDGGSTFGWILFGVGVFLYFFMDVQKSNLRESGGALTKRKLGEDDLMGLKKKELEQLRCHIYAKHGYNFNVNDGLSYLEIVFNKLNSVYPNGFKFELSDIPEASNKIGCSGGQLLLVLENYHEIKKWKNIGKTSDNRKSILRERIEPKYVNGYGTLEVGLFNRNGEYGHEGHHYYYFKYSDWYKPTTNNLDEVYAKMSDIEKYNVEFIKAHEA